MKYFNSWFTLALLLLAGSSSVLANALSSAEPESTVINQVAVDNSLITVRMENVPMEDALRAITERAGMEISIEGQLGGPVSVSFQDRSLNQGLREILGDTPVGIWKDEENRIHVHVLGLYNATDDDPVVENTKADSSTPLADPFPDSTTTALMPLASVTEHIASVENDNDLADLIAYDPDPVVRRLAVIKLGKRQSDSSVSALALGLEDVNRTVRLRSVVSIGKIGNKAAIELLSEVLLYDPSAVIRRMAATQLTKSRHSWAKVALQTASGDTDDKVRTIAENALARLNSNQKTGF